MTQAITPEEVIAKAIATAGTDDFGAEGWREGLARTLDAFVRISLKPEVFTTSVDKLVHDLATRLRIEQWFKDHPECAESQIEGPVFVIGLPRTGTTLLHALLAEDPAVHAPQSWHMLSPSPPPGNGPVAAGRIAHAQRVIDDWMHFCPAQKMMHPYIDKGAWQLTEDEEVYGLDFRNVYPFHYYHVPTADFGVRLGDEAPGAYKFHRKFLQHHQWNTGKHRWVCKSPSAQGYLVAMGGIVSAITVVVSGLIYARWGSGVYFVMALMAAAGGMVMLVWRSRLDLS